MLHVLTTVGQHPKGLDLHLRNLRWALGGCPHRIHVQTHAGWGFRREGVTFVERPTENPLWFHLFWDEAAPYLQGLLGDAEVFLFAEQDVFFTRPLADQHSLCHDHQAVVLNLESPYLSIFDAAGRKVYPRIWEGGSWIPAPVLAEALEQGVSLGSIHRGFRPGGSLYRRFLPRLEGHSTTRRGGRVDEGLEPLPAFLHIDAVDTLFELTLYCFAAGKAWESSPENDRDLEFGECAVHFRNPESIHRDYPQVYEDLGVLWRLPAWYDRRLNDCALMFYLAGAAQESDTLRDLLRHPPGLVMVQEKAKKLAPRAAEWMSEEELRRFSWACRVIGVNPPTRP